MADIDSPIQPVGQSASGPEPSAEQIGALADMGFTAPQARKALRETVYNIKCIIHVLLLI
jgi:ubiquitin carboxyl-terminal hydrolase 5/13